MNPEDLELEPSRVRLEDARGLLEQNPEALGVHFIADQPVLILPPVSMGRRDGMSAGFAARFASRAYPRRKLWRGPDQQSVLMLQVLGQMWDTWERQR